MADRQPEGLQILETIPQNEKDSNKYLGTTLFWKYFDDINLKNIYRTDSIEYRNIKFMAFEAIFYLILLTFFTLYITEYKSSLIYAAKEHQKMYWSGCDPSGNCELDHVTNHEEFYNWMRGSFIPKAFIHRNEFPEWNKNVTFDLNENSIKWNPRYVTDTQTVAMLGNVRIRQLRVKPKGPIEEGGCALNERLFKGDPEEFICYPKYSAMRESTVAYADTWTPNKEIYTWNPARVTNQIPIVGHMGTYDASGYFFDLPLSRNEALKRMNACQEWNWMDDATRAMIVEFTVVNPNINIIINHRFLFEFGPTGSKASHHIFPFRVATLSLSLLEEDMRSLWMIQFTILAFFIIFIMFTLFTLFQSGFSFFFYLWNLVDVLIIAFGILFIVEQAYVYEMFTNPLEKDFNPFIMGQPQIFPPFSKLISPVQQCNNWLSFLSFFIWFRVTKYFTLLHSFRLLVRVLEKTVWDLWVFLCLLLTIFAGFSVAFHVGFGHLQAFSTVYTAFFSLFFMLASSTEISGLFDSSWLGEALYVAYLILVYFLLFNMFMAVVIDTYSLATMLKRNFQQNDSPLACWIVAYLNKLRGISLVGREQNIDCGGPHEQFINTELLPKPVAEAWLKKHDEMLDICIKNGYKIDMRKDVVSRVQMQRMLDEDHGLVEWLGTAKAIQVIRRFKVPELQDPYAEITLLQERVFAKIEELQKQDFNMDFSSLESLKIVSQGLHNALTEVQNDWRAELTSVLEVVSDLAEQLMSITGKLEKVQTNHSKISAEVMQQERQNM